MVVQYDFHKTVQDPNHGEFQHQYFREHRQDLLVHIKRKGHNRGADIAKKPKTKLEGIDTQPLPLILTEETSEFGDDILSERFETIPTDSKNSITSHDAQLRLGDGNENSGDQQQQQSLQGHLERRLAGIEQNSERLSRENVMLKQALMETRLNQTKMQEKMGSVLKMLYNAFVDNSNILPPSAIRSAVSACDGAIRSG